MMAYVLKDVVVAVLGMVLIAFAAIGCSQSTPSGTAPADSLEDRSAAAQTMELPEAETARLWELEHRANVLGEFGFGRLKDALARGDRAALSTLLSDDFSGETWIGEASASYTHDSLTAWRREPSDEPAAERLNAEQFLDRLMDLRQQLSDVDSCSIGIKRIGPLDRSNPEQTWKSRCQLWMRGQNAVERVEVSVLFEILTPMPEKQQLVDQPWIKKWILHETAMARSDRPTFRDVTRQSGLDASRLHDNWNSKKKINNLGGIYVCDYNRDHLSDVLVTDINPIGNSLYEGQLDGTFRDVTNLIGIGRIRQVALNTGNAAFVDLNNDGWVDLLHTEGAIWENRGGREFVERTAESNLFEILDRRNIEVKALSIADYDRDGNMDLYALRRNEMPTSWLEGTGDGPGSVLCRNLGNWQFEDVTEATGTDGHRSLIFTTVWLDADNDGWPDIAVINEFGDSFLYRNIAGKRFEKIDPNPNKSDFGSMGVDVGDINNDGLIDLYIAGMYSKAGSRVIGNLDSSAFPPAVMQRLNSLIDGSELYVNQGGNRFEAAGQAARVHDVGWSWGPTLADFNNDGWLDIYAPSGYMSRDRNRPDG